MLLGRGWSRAPRRNEHGGAILEGSSTGHGTGHSGIVRQACVTVAWRQKGLLTAVVLWLALRLGLSLRRLRLGLVLSLALALGRLCGCQTCGRCWGGGVIPAELCDFTCATGPHRVRTNAGLQGRRSDRPRVWGIYLSKDCWLGSRLCQRGSLWGLGM